MGKSRKTRKKLRAQDDFTSAGSDGDMDPGGALVDMGPPSKVIGYEDFQTPLPLVPEGDRRRPVGPGSGNLSRASSDLIDSGSSSEDDDRDLRRKSPPPPPEVQVLSYSATDPGPFVVVVSCEERNISGLYPLAVGRRFSFHHVHPSDVCKSGRGRVNVILPSAAEANKLLALAPQLGRDDGWSLSLPQSQQPVSYGVIRRLPPSIELADIVVGAEASNGVRVSEAVQLRRRASDSSGAPVWVPCNSWKVKFNSRDRPDKLRLYGCVIPVEPYVFSVTQCDQCFMFGHPKKYCKGRPRCGQCGDFAHDEGATCPAKTPSCRNCKGPQLSWDPTCPRRQEERDIKTVMAADNISYAAAVQRSLLSQLLMVDTVSLGEYHLLASQHFLFDLEVSPTGFGW
ncbi:hypothetical protein FOCC_FOCC014681 [Frankliniella occidentalis]|nr:hypothetical protein FOCC_FOCC014681 [Frankliniella occidentalis]